MNQNFILCHPWFFLKGQTGNHSIKLVSAFLTGLSCGVADWGNCALLGKNWLAKKVNFLTYNLRNKVLKSGPPCKKFLSRAMRHSAGSNLKGE
jgi:hypothetical protein